ncbi:MAG: HAD family phosphatase [Planctomycetota bacterium]
MLELPYDRRGLIFDCDGTLVDSMPLHLRLWNECLADYCVQVTEDFIATHAGKPTGVIVEIINADRGLEIDPASFEHEKESRYRELVHEVAPVEPVVAAAEHFRWHFPMAVVSGGVRANVDASLRAIDALDWFKVILSADDPISPKPAPDLFLAAAERLGVPPAHCHVFEDADAGVQAAHAAGMTVTDVRELLVAR